MSFLPKNCLIIKTHVDDINDLHYSHNQPVTRQQHQQQQYTHKEIKF